MDDLLIYIGHTIVKQNLRHGDVFKEIPCHITDEKVKELIIPLNKLQEVQRELKNPLSFYSLKIKELKNRRV